MYIYFRKDTRQFSHVSETVNGGSWLLEFEKDGIDPNYTYQLLDDDSIVIGEELPSMQSINIAELEMQELRKIRNIKLAETDWMATVDSKVFTPDVVTYRQALRDVTEQYTSIHNVVWPGKPSSVK